MNMTDHVLNLLPRPARSRSRTVTLGVVLAITLASGIAAAADPGSGRAAASATPAIERTLTVFVDPDSYEMDVLPGPGRVPLTLSLNELNALDMSSEDLTAVVADGVTLIDFRGRFRPVWVAVQTPDGAMRPLCLTTLPASVQAAAQAVREEARRDR